MYNIKKKLKKKIQSTRFLEIILHTGMTITDIYLYSCTSRIMQATWKVLMQRLTMICHDLLLHNILFEFDKYLI